ncbi:DegV family protein [Fusibacter sp. 3D3]|uniref:DegV family protein n=1 Tax=Fusibacter sp. 3D3 TaxID=1048380 RepID=UPI0008533591|nr:DegV family protein [Fusibacter sp. 3D3]GAU78101.1 dihydroxyacetone kinase family protein [Fusibacter sp. 3D3]
MNKQTLDGNQFYKLFRSGVGTVVAQKEILNSTNVFPVMDGDTGTNLMMTLTSILDETKISSDFSVVINSISDAAIENARGNSGAIFASFLNGFSKSCGHLKELTMEAFGLGVVKASNEAYESVSHPVEGTMLTVIRVWADFINKEYKFFASFSDLFNEAYEKALITLEETPLHLEILNKYHVVDSGAKGFVYFLEGINSVSDETFLKENNNFEIGDFKKLSIVHNETEAFSAENRYCCEFTLKGKFEGRKTLGSFGDEIVITGNQRVTKVHIHSNNPIGITEFFIKESHFISKAKVDDMLLQVQVRNHQKSKIGILTDSICDLPPALFEKYQIHMIALNVHSNNQTYLDKQTLNFDILSRLLESNSYPQSSQADVGQIKLKLDWMLMYYESIIVVSVSSRLSGMFESYKKAIRVAKNNGKNITLIDSKLNSGAQGLLVLRAAELTLTNFTHEDIVQALNQIAKKTRIFVSLDTFKYAVKSGRVPNIVGKFGMFLNLKPIMTLDDMGSGTAFGIALSTKGINKKIEKLVKYIFVNEGIVDYAIVHAANFEMATQYSERFIEILGVSPKFVSEISSITAIHAGKGAVAIAFIKGDNCKE